MISDSLLMVEGVEVLSGFPRFFILMFSFTDAQQPSQSVLNLISIAIVHRNKFFYCIRYVAMTT